MASITNKLKQGICVDLNITEVALAKGVKVQLIKKSSRALILKNKERNSQEN